MNDKNYRNIRTLSNNYKKYQVKAIEISKILDYMGGNAGLTEEKIYHNILKGGEQYHVLSATSSLDEKLGKIPVCNINGRALKIFKNKEGVLVTRVGKAGNCTFLTKGKYTITDNAYILSLKDDHGYKVNLKWLIYQLKPVFFEYAPIADYGAWNMTGFFKNVTVDIPSEEEQLEVVEKYEKLEKLRESVFIPKLKIDELN